MDRGRKSEHVIFDLNKINLHFYTIKQIHTQYYVLMISLLKTKNRSVSRTHTHFYKWLYFMFVCVVRVFKFLGSREHKSNI